ncbi:MAG: hypothetical protein R3C40_01465 [Parvularculaceae bacterium]
MKRIAVIFSILFSALFAQAQAATTVYATSVVSRTGFTVNVAGALGAPDASYAFMGGGASLVLQLSSAVPASNIVLNGAFLTPGSSVWVSVGEVIGGTATYSTQVLFSGGFPAAFDFSTACSAISASGCSLLRFTTTGGSWVALNSVSGVSNAPEPSIWAMMIIAFGFTAWRMKKIRPRMALAIA